MAKGRGQRGGSGRGTIRSPFFESSADYRTKRPMRVLDLGLSCGGTRLAKNAERVVVLLHQSFPLPDPNPWQLSALMNTRIFGKTGRVVGEVGLGCWQIGGNWGEVSDE